tara:strand:- start:38 stop:313 length:276 start_codon:yes stop_codon:yes gene_type:complete
MTDPTVEDIMMRNQELMVENERFRKALEDIANFVRWGIQYRYIAVEALEGDKSVDLDFPVGMSFNNNGDLVTDYGPEHDPEYQRMIKEDNQ